MLSKQVIKTLEFIQKTDAASAVATKEIENAPPHAPLQRIVVLGLREEPEERSTIMGDLSFAEKEAPPASCPHVALLAAMDMGTFPETIEEISLLTYKNGSSVCIQCNETPACGHYAVQLMMLNPLATDVKELIEATIDDSGNHPRCVQCGADLNLASSEPITMEMGVEAVTRQLSAGPTALLPIDALRRIFGQVIWAGPLPAALRSRLTIISDPLLLIAWHAVADYFPSGSIELLNLYFTAGFALILVCLVLQHPSLFTKADLAWKRPLSTDPESIWEDLKTYLIKRNPAHGALASVFSSFVKDIAETCAPHSALMADVEAFIARYITRKIIVPTAHLPNPIGRVTPLIKNLSFTVPLLNCPQELSWSEVPKDLIYGLDGHEHTPWSDKCLICKEAPSEKNSVPHDVYMTAFAWFTNRSEFCHGQTKHCFEEQVCLNCSWHANTTLKMAIELIKKEKLASILTFVPVELPSIKQNIDAPFAPPGPEATHQHCAKCLAKTSNLITKKNMQWYLAAFDDAELYTPSSFGSHVYTYAYLLNGLLLQHELMSPQTARGFKAQFHVAEFALDETPIYKELCLMWLASLAVLVPAQPEEALLSSAGWARWKQSATNEWDLHHERRHDVAYNILEVANKYLDHFGAARGSNSVEEEPIVDEHDISGPPEPNQAEPNEKDDDDVSLEDVNEEDFNDEDN